MNPADIDIHAWPASRGGQQVTRTTTGILAIHRPTGIAFVCESERSQHANRLKAIEGLRGMVLSEEEREALEDLREELHANAQNWDPGGTADIIAILDKLLGGKAGG